MRIIRGKRILDALAYVAEETTYPELYRNIQTGFPDTKKRQHVASQVNIGKVQYVPIEGSAVLQVNAQVNSNGNQYTPVAQFTKVVYTKEEGPNTATFKGSDNEDHTIETINLPTNNVKVRCNCLDFHFRFSKQNFSDQALVGDPPPLYRRKTMNRPPANPANVPGLCKHLIKLFDMLKRYGLVR